MGSVHVNFTWFTAMAVPLPGEVQGPFARGSRNSSLTDYGRGELSPLSSDSPVFSPPQGTPVDTPWFKRRSDRPRPRAHHYNTQSPDLSSYWCVLFMSSSGWRPVDGPVEPVWCVVSLRVHRCYHTRGCWPWRVHLASCIGDGSQIMCRYCYLRFVSDYSTFRDTD